MHSIEQRFTVGYQYPVIFTRNVFHSGNVVLRDVVARAGSGRRRLLVAVDSELARATPGLLESIGNYAKAHAEVMDVVAPPVIVRGGEVCKREPLEVERVYALIERYGLCRHSYVLAVGGGAVLDAVGYAAATAHRGVRLIRLPTTVLAQNDAGIGVKNGVNAFGRKNFLGTFAPPFAVINDFDFLSTLQARDLRGGIAEAVKVALIRDRAFFDELYGSRNALAAFEAPALERMIFRCSQLHLRHIAEYGDPFESGSSRPLDFGHWNAHKLEELTHGELRHGEAVAVGIALDAHYSCRAGSLADLDLRRILTLLEDVGFELYHPALSSLDVEKSLEDFREHLGGELSIPLLAGIGEKIEAAYIDTALMKSCIAELAQRAVNKAWQRGEPSLDGGLTMQPSLEAESQIKSPLSTLRKGGDVQGRFTSWDWTSNFGGGLTEEDRTG